MSGVTHLSEDVKIKTFDIAHSLFYYDKIMKGSRPPEIQRVMTRDVQTALCSLYLTEDVTLDADVH